MIERGASLSPDGRHRVHLWRADTLEARAPCCWVMLNPSTADALEDDATIRRCVGFARGWGCDRIDVVNLFSFRATDPRDLVNAAFGRGSVVHPINDATVAHFARRARFVVVAWGNVPAGLTGRDRAVVALLEQYGIRPLCLGTTKSGAPRHPVRLAGSTPLVVWTPPA